ncbi:MAG: aminoacyl-tRNA hydrolase [Gammaproteobacteria bacterium]|nr:aminoacyl-tRNA hydrolase [Gammaproteobacteria bacterium]
MTDLEALGIDAGELEFSAVRAQGPGGQNVNKVASAVVLRFDIGRSRLPERVKQALLTRGDRRISREGIVQIKAQRHRTQERNREDAIARLAALIEAARERPAPRLPTRVPAGARQRRLEAKRERAGVKALRRRPPGDD